MVLLSNDDLLRITPLQLCSFSSRMNTTYASRVYKKIIVGLSNVLLFECGTKGEDN